MALVDNAWYVDFGDGSTTGYFAVTKWATGVSKVCGNLIRQNTAPAVGSERVFVCVASTGGTGTTGATEPTWTVTRGAKNTDNTLTWQEATGVAALNGDLTNTPKWTDANIKGNAITLGQVIQNSAGTLILICTTAGTAGSGAEPSWSAFTNAGATTADNTVTWTTLGASFSSWAAPHARVGNSFASGWGQNGNKFYVASEHAETQATSLTLNPPSNFSTPAQILCVTKTAVPPTAANLTTGASISVTGATTLTLGTSSGGYWNGVKFQAGSGASAGVLTISGATFALISMFKNCTFALLGTASGSTINLANGSTPARAVFDGCTFTSAAAYTIWMTSGTNTDITMRGCNWSGTAPTNLLDGPGGEPLLMEGCDLSNITTSLWSGGSAGRGTIAVLKDCKIASGVTLNNMGVPTQKAYLVRSDSGNTNYRHEVYTGSGKQTVDTTVVRTGGASDGTTPLSWKVTPGFNIGFLIPFECFPISIWNTQTGANRTVTIFGVLAGASLPTNANIWAQIEYLGTAGSPLGVMNDMSPGNPLAAASNWSADTSAWDTAATARANLHAYVFGNTISVASNPGRIFICTSGGTSAASEPAGYASAVDGSSVTDGGAVFVAGVRFAMAVTLSSPQPQLAGPITAYIKSALSGSALVWIDPLLGLS